MQTIFVDAKQHAYAMYFPYLCAVVVQFTHSPHESPSSPASHRPFHSSVRKTISCLLGLWRYQIIQCQHFFFLNSHMLYHLHKVEGISFTNVMNVDNCSSYVARVEQWTAIWTTKVSSILNLVGTRLPKAKLIIGFKTRRYMLVRGYISTKHWYNNTLVLKLDKDYLHKKLF